MSSPPVASVVIAALNKKRSAAIAVFDGSEMKPAGNVTIPPDHPIPDIGLVAEVRYLYVMPESSALFQPVYLGLREDVEPTRVRPRSVEIQGGGLRSGYR